MNTDDIRTTTTIVPAAPGWFVADFCPDYSPDEACFVCHPIIAWEVRCEEGRMWGWVGAAWHRVSVCKRDT